MSRFSGGGGPSQRQLRVGELVRHGLVEVFSRGEVPAEHLDGTITVLEVSMSPDLRQARVYVMPLAGRDAADVMEALRRSVKPIRGALSKRLNLKYMPALTFELDTSLDYASKMDALLN
ncbi:MAG: 30S ribosome-binding factor RbfA, partial [Hyphomicrobiales bacterium]